VFGAGITKAPVVVVVVVVVEPSALVTGLVTELDEFGSQWGVTSAAWPAMIPDPGVRSHKPPDGPVTVVTVGMLAGVGPVVVAGEVEVVVVPSGFVTVVVVVAEVLTEGVALAVIVALYALNAGLPWLAGSFGFSQPPPPGALAPMTTVPVSAPLRRGP
jgi:hypothetical protein